MILGPKTLHTQVKRLDNSDYKVRSIRSKGRPSGLVVSVSEKNCQSPSDVREVRHIYVQKLSEAELCPNIVRTFTMAIILMSCVFGVFASYIEPCDMTSVFFKDNHH